MTPAQAMDTGGRLIHLLTQQRLLYRQLQELAKKQTDLVDGSDAEMLLRVLASRQRLIDRLSAIDRELEPIRSQWNDVARLLPTQQREDAQQLVSEIKEILGEIIARDEKDTQKLSQCRQQVAGQIRSATTGKKVNQAYAQSTSVRESRFIDTQSG